MNDEEKWKAVVKCDNDYDGLFYYAVKTTGIFCRPSCKAKVPLKKNILFFDSVDEALISGFRPCKMCRPDVNEADYEPNKELTKKIKELLNNSFHTSLYPNKISQEFGLSYNHFLRLFKHYYGMTVNEYITELRVTESIKLLIVTNEDIITIAFEVGFKSVSNFYKCFKGKTGTTPRKYRNSNLQNR